MLRCQLKALDTWQGIFQLFLKIFFIISKFAADVSADFSGLFRIFNKLHATEYNNTVDVQRPLAFFAIAFIMNTVADLVAFCDRIELVSFLRAVEIQFPILIHEVDGNGIRIAPVTDDGQEATISRLQDGDAFLVRKLLLEPAHGPESG